MISKFPKRVKYEMIIVLLIFGASFLLPFCTFYYEGESDAHIIEKPQYISDFLFGYVYIAFMLLVIFALLSAVELVLIVISILVVIFLSLSYILIQLSFTWWGASPYHPSLGIGFVLVNVIIIYFIFRSFFWISPLINHSKEQEGNGEELE